MEQTAEAIGGKSKARVQAILLNITRLLTRCDKGPSRSLRYQICSIREYDEVIGGLQKLECYRRDILAVTYRLEICNHIMRTIYRGRKEFRVPTLYINFRFREDPIPLALNPCKIEL